MIIPPPLTVPCGPGSAMCLQVEMAQRLGAAAVFVVDKGTADPFRMGGSSLHVSIAAFSLTAAEGKTQQLLDLMASSAAAPPAGGDRAALLVDLPLWLTDRDGGPNTIASYSSKGPTFDGRIKPDVLSVGGPTFSARSDGSLRTNNCGAVLQRSDLAVVSKQGTSMAAPLVAAAAALVRQYFMEGFYPTGAAERLDEMKPSAALIKAMLINSAQPLPPQAQGKLSWPGNEQGWGSIALDRVLLFRDRFANGDLKDPRQPKLWVYEGVVDKFERRGRTANKSWCFRTTVENAPVKATLVYTDLPSSAAAGPVLVNNIDLLYMDVLALTGGSGTANCMVNTGKCFFGELGPSAHGCGPLEPLPLYPSQLSCLT